MIIRNITPKKVSPADTLLTADAIGGNAVNAYDNLAAMTLFTVERRDLQGQSLRKKFCILF
jgi:hypothetical protein